jgi:aerotaxis receptor
MSVRSEPSREQVTAAEALYQKLKEGKASIPQPSAWMRISLKAKLTGLVLMAACYATACRGGAECWGLALGISTRSLDLTVKLISASSLVAGVWLLVIQNKMMGIIQRIISRLDNIAQGDLTDPIPLHRVDELGRLNDSLVTMQTHLKAMLAEIAEAADEVGGECRCAERGNGPDAPGHQSPIRRGQQHCLRQLNNWLLRSMKLPAVRSRHRTQSTRRTTC